jgi:hypothetical protein
LAGASDVLVNGLSTRYDVASPRMEAAVVLAACWRSRAVTVE